MAKITKQSPFAPTENIEVFDINGMECASINCGLYKHKEDLSLFLFKTNTTVAGVFTKSQMASPPVLTCKENLKTGKASALIVNSGNSFAMTGKKGQKAIDEITSSISQEFNIPKNEIFICSTGVIGYLPEYQKIIKGLPKLKEKLSKDSISQTASAIMTTDTFPKIYSKKFTINGKEITISGIAKGSGMIEPNMATMLSFIFTDAKISSTDLQEIVSQHVKTTFNAITVDSDTSTSDSLIVFATNQVEIDNNISEFSSKMKDAMESLAKQIILDGEGITKLITVKVSGAKSFESAQIIGKAIANSPLIKTAITGCDPNWGRIAMAIGKTSEDINLEKLIISIGNNIIYENEEISPLYNEESVYKHMCGDYIDISVNVGVGNFSATIWGCNLTHEYININADYRS